MKESIPWNIILKVLDNPQDTELLKMLEKWIGESSENEKIFNKIKERWLISGKIPMNFSPDANKALRSVKGQLGHKQQRFISTNMFRYAAAATIALLIGISGFFFFNSSPEIILANSNTVNYVNLPDGSKVWLNKNTTLSYPEVFSNNIREVLLEGEAYFEIAKNPEKPFTVKANGSQTKVLGTHFNIKAYPGEEKVSIVVSEGKVAFSGINNKQSVLLTAGDKALYSVSLQVIEKKAIDNPNYLSWKTNEYSFDNVTIESVIKTIAENNHAVYMFKDSSLKGLMLNASFRGKSLDEILKIISVTIDANIELYPDNKIIISKKIE